MDKWLRKYILKLRWKFMLQDYCLQFVGDLHLKHYHSENCMQCGSGTGFNSVISNNTFDYIAYYCYNCREKRIPKPTCKDLLLKWQQNLIFRILKHTLTIEQYRSMVKLHVCYETKQQRQHRMLFYLYATDYFATREEQLKNKRIQG